MELTVVVDRIEGELAILEVGDRMVDWPLSALPPDAREGARFAFCIRPIESDDEEDKKRLERLGARGPKGDIIDL